MRCSCGLTHVGSSRRSARWLRWFQLGSGRRRCTSAIACWARVNCPVCIRRRRSGQPSAHVGTRPSWRYFRLSVPPGHTCLHHVRWRVNYSRHTHTAGASALRACSCSLSSGRHLLGTQVVSICRLPGVGQNGCVGRPPPDPCSVKPLLQDTAQALP